MKQCTRCKRLLPLTEFHKHKPSKDGRKPRCKRCRCELQKRYCLDNPEKKRESDRNYYLNNTEAKREYSKRWSKNNKDRKKITDIEYRINNSDKLKRYHQDYYRKNRQEKLEYSKRYAASNKEKIKQYQKKYRKNNNEKLKQHQKKIRQNNREQYKVYGLNYIARKNNADGFYTLEQWQKLCSFFNGICPCCRKKVSNFTVDHIIPLTWDGTSNWIANIQPLCKSCNTGKSNYHDTDYRPDYVREWANVEAIAQYA